MARRKWPWMLALAAVFAIPLWIEAQDRREDTYPYSQGTAVVNDGTPNAVINTSPGAGWFLSTERVLVACHEAAIGGNGYVNLRSAGTVIWEADADSPFYATLDFGERGYKAGTANTSLDLEVSGGAGVQASCIATGISHLFNR